MSESRVLSPEEEILLARFSRVRRERRRVRLKRLNLESVLSLCTSIRATVDEEPEVTDDLQRLLSVVSHRESVVRRRLAGRTHSEEWFDRVVTHAENIVRSEITR